MPLVGGWLWPSKAKTSPLITLIRQARDRSPLISADPEITKFLPL
jgi:hypothetical protein